MISILNFPSYKSLRKSKEISLENLCVGNIWIFVCEYCGLKVLAKEQINYYS